MLDTAYWMLEKMVWGIGYRVEGTGWKV
jgi:hypothetical protein